MCPPPANRLRALLTVSVRDDDHVNLWCAVSRPWFAMFPSPIQSASRGMRTCDTRTRNSPAGSRGSTAWPAFGMRIRDPETNQTPRARGPAGPRVLRFAFRRRSACRDRHAPGGNLWQHSWRTRGRHL